MPQKPLDISTPLFYPCAEEQQASLPGEQPCDADAARIHKSVRVCSHMVHQSTRCKKLQRVFYCNLSKKVQSGAPSGDENSSGPPPVRRAKTPQWGVFRARESPRWCTRKSRNECCGFFVAPFPLGRTRTSRKRSCSSRGDWSLKMAAGLWAGATIERERKRGANNVRRALRTTARAVLRSKMEALQADKRTRLNS